jgi:hypothetical protein
MAIKPADGHIDWITDDDSQKYIAPSAAKRLQGWVQQEKPPYQYFNWAWRLVDRWLKWAEAQSDENAAAIAVNAAHAGDTGNPHGVTKAQVGLGSVPDTDFTAAVSANTTHGGRTDNPHGVTKTQVGLDQASNVPAGTFVNNASGHPLIDTGSLYASSVIAESTWQSVGPSGSGAYRTWTALDAVPSNADWIEVRVAISNESGPSGSYLICNVHARATGSSQSASSYNRIGTAAALSSSSGGARVMGTACHKIPVDASGRFDVNWDSNFTATNIYLYLVGWGFNP